MAEYVYCAVNERGEIQWVMVSSQRTRYFKTTRYLRKAVNYHNTYYSNDPWHIVAWLLEPSEGVIFNG